MADVVVANSHIRDLARGAAPWIFRCKQNGKTYLSESSPGVLKNISLKQNPLGIFKFKEILDNKWISIGSANVSRFAFHPGQRFEHVIVADLDVRRDLGGTASAENDALCSSFQKVICDLVRSHGIIAETSGDCLRIRAGTGLGDAVKIREVRIHNGGIARSAQQNTSNRRIFRGSVNPKTIEYHVIRWA